jgi:agmatine deiminase
MTTYRMPVEWAPHEATWLGWPAEETDWPGKLQQAKWGICEFARLLTRDSALPEAPNERVEMLCRDERQRDEAAEMLAAAGVTMDRVRLHVFDTDRTWLRDCAPTFVRDEAKGDLVAIDWRFTGWARYPNHTKDDLVPALVERVANVRRVEAVRPDSGERLVLEGGAIEIGASGTVLVTEECLLDQERQCRNPGMSRADYERVLREYLGATRVVWLGIGATADDTHGHIDDIARFVPAASKSGKEIVVLAYEENPNDENHTPSVENKRRLEREGFEVVAVPFPDPVFFDGERLPASYANFYVANAGVLVPVFNDPKDADALATIGALFPDRPALPVYARDLVLGTGTLHCLSQQQPTR